MSLSAIIIQIIHKKGVIKVFHSLRYAKTNQNGILCSFRDFENLIILEKTALKPSTRIGYFFFLLLLVKFVGYTIIGRGRKFSKFH